MTAMSTLKKSDEISLLPAMAPIISEEVHLAIRDVLALLIVVVTMMTTIMAEIHVAAVEIEEVNSHILLPYLSLADILQRRRTSI